MTKTKTKKKKTMNTQKSDTGIRFCPSCGCNIEAIASAAKLISEM